MINKKLLTVASVVAALATSSAFAKTEGSYLGLNAIRTSANSKIDGDKYKDNQIGFGVDYKYAINFNGAFITPGVFAEMNNTQAKKSSQETEEGEIEGTIDGKYFNKSVYNSKIETKGRYGIKADIGYDITDNFAAYLTNGLSINRYQFKDNSFEYSENSIEGVLVDSSTQYKKSGNKVGYFYGAGLAFAPIKDVSINAEYNIQNVSYKVEDGKIKNDIKVAKIGVAYHF